MPLYVADAMDVADRDALRHHLAAGCTACAGWLAEARPRSPPSRWGSTRSGRRRSCWPG